MTWEAVSALAALVSALIVAVAAVAAVIQIRHLRAGNQLTAILRIYETFNSAEMVEARRYILHEIPILLADDETRRAIFERVTDPRLSQLCNFFNEIGSLVAEGFLDERLVTPIVPPAARVWRVVAPIAQEWRGQDGSPVWIDFEYIAALEEKLDLDRYIARYPAWFQERITPAVIERAAAEARR